MITKTTSLLCVTLAVVLLPTTALGQTSGTDPLAYSGPAWSPYLAGALIGVLSWFTFYFAKKPLAASTAYAHLAGLLGKALAPRKTESLKFYQDTPPKIEWEVMLMAGVVVGASLAALSGGEWTGRWVPPMWEARFGGSVFIRLAVAFVGGAVMAFGARLAGGCTSGHGISGTLQLAVGSWIALFCFFLGGIPVALLLYRL